MGRISRVASALISLAISVVTILFLYNYLAPIGLSNSILGPQYASLTSSTGYGALVPGGIAGIIAFTVLSRLGSVASAATAPSAPNPEDMMRRMNFPGMMGGGQASVPTTLPADITRSQFVVLRSLRQGLKNSKEISKSLSMDKGHIESDMSTLKTNGYLTDGNKLTSKAMDLLGN